MINEEVMKFMLFVNLKRLLLVGMLLANVCLAQPFKIVGIPGAPLRYIEEGNVVGIDVDIVDAIMKRLNIEYEVVLLNSSTRLKKLWQDPNVDMILTYSHKEERFRHLTYAKQSHITLGWNFFVRKENFVKIDYEKPEDLAGLKVGATLGFAYTSEFWEAAEEGIFKLDTVVKNELNLKKLVHGRFDTFANIREDTLYQAKLAGYLDEIAYLPTPLKEKKYYNTFVKVSDYPNLENVIARYDEELLKMKLDGSIDNIYKKYFAPTNN